MVRININEKYLSKNSNTCAEKREYKKYSLYILKLRRSSRNSKRDNRLQFYEYMHNEIEYSGCSYSRQSPRHDCPKLVVLTSVQSGYERRESRYLAPEMRSGEPIGSRSFSSLSMRLRLSPLLGRSLKSRTQLRRSGISNTKSTGSHTPRGYPSLLFARFDNQKNWKPIFHRARTESLKYSLPTSPVRGTRGGIFRGSNLENSPMDTFLSQLEY